jgi:hypothetical protein
MNEDALSILGSDGSAGLHLGHAGVAVIVNVGLSQVLVSCVLVRHV